MGWVGIGRGNHDFDENRFEAADAGQLPAGLRHLFNQEGLVLAGWGELVLKVVTEAIERGLVLMGINLEAARQVVLNRITAGDGLAFRRGRAGTEQRVRLIRADLR